ncbi:hypothetical protein STRDD10_01774 [Streptococcus sp. DD10]|nr:hypothetical protein STRDD10_01774 [Streptococcus sp. DD10]
MRGGTRQAHPQHFNGCCHGVSGVHPTTATRARAGITFETFHILSRHVSVVPFSDSFKDGNEVDVFSVKISWCNGPSIGKDSWNIHVGNGNHGAWHVFVTAPNRYKGIHIVSTHGSFDRVRDNVTRGQREAHSRRSHGDSVCYRNCPKLHRPCTCSFNSLFGKFSKVMEVDVTRRVFSPG